MLIRFSIENWMFFQIKATFSLIASRERQHGERIPKIGKLKLGVSNLLSFSEYKDVRYDKDIRKSYFQGLIGGIPRILL